MPLLGRTAPCSRWARGHAGNCACDVRRAATLCVSIAWADASLSVMRLCGMQVTNLNLSTSTAHGTEVCFVLDRTKCATLGSFCAGEGHCLITAMSRADKCCPVQRWPVRQ